MHPEMMKLLGEARMQQVSGDLARDSHLRERPGGRRYRLGRRYLTAREHG